MLQKALEQAREAGYRVMPSYFTVSLICSGDWEHAVRYFEVLLRGEKGIDIIAGTRFKINIVINLRKRVNFDRCVMRLPGFYYESPPVLRWRGPSRKMGNIAKTACGIKISDG